LAVRIVERRRDGPRDLHGVFERKAMLSLEALPQRLAFDKRHHVVQQIVGAARVVHRHDVRMLQPARDLNLAQESLGPKALGQMRMQDLDGNRSVVPHVVRAVDARPRSGRRAQRSAWRSGPLSLHSSSSTGFAPGRAELALTYPAEPAHASLPLVQSEHSTLGQCLSPIDDQQKRPYPRVLLTI
jgi:hypothetical protein